MVKAFRQKKNKKGESYGWPIAVYATPEKLFGYEHVREIYPIATEKQIKKILK